MAFKLNPFTGKLETSEPGPKGDTGTVAAAGDGSQGTPSISFTSDPDTGFYKYTTNGIGVSTAGTGRLFINSNGNVGIGATSANSSLLVQRTDATAYSGTARNNQFVMIYNPSTAAGAYAGLELHVDGTGNSSTANISAIDSGSGSADLAFGLRQNNVFGEKLRINAAGNVGVGTSSPQANLHIVGASGGAGEIYVSDVDVSSAGSSSLLLSQSGNNSFIYNRNTSGQLRLGAGGASNNLVIATSGNVGVGTTSPDRKLHVRSDGSYALKVGGESGGAYYLELGQVSASSSPGINYSGTSASLRFLNNGSEVARFNSAGNLGIGVTTVSNVLHVHQSDASANSYVHITQADGGSAATDGLSIGIEDGGVNAVIRNRENGYLRMYTNNTERMRIDSSGNVGVGTSSPSSYNANGDNLVVLDSGSAGITIAAGSTSYSSLYFADGTSGAQTYAGYVQYNHTDDKLYIGSGADNTITCDSSQRVGVGTTSPDANSQLHIVGSSYQPLYVNTTGTGGGGAAFFRSGTQALYVGTAGSSWLSGSSTADGLVRAEANLVLATNGNSRAVTIDSSQRVGIGTSSPISGGKLTVDSGSSDNFTYYQARGANSLESSSVFLTKNSSGTNVGGSIGHDGSTNTLYLTGLTSGASTQHVSIDSNGKVGIGTTAPDKLLTAEGSTTPTIKVKTTSSASYSTSDAVNDANDYIQLFANGSARAAFGALGTGETGLVSNKSLSIMAANSGQDIKFATGGSTERARIDSSGRLLVGTSSSPSAGDGQYGLLVVSGHTLGAACYASFQREEPATSITNDETIAWLNFGDQAGNSFANIKCIADADAGSGDYPGRLVFSTTADGASSPTERMRINNLGQVGIGSSGFSPNIYNLFLRSAGNTYLGSGLTVGKSGSDYDGAGYNVGWQSSTSSYKYVFSDTAAFIKYGSGGGRIETFTAPSGTGGNAITFTAGPYVAEGGTSWTSSSDERLKEDLLPIENGLAKVGSLRAVTGRFKTDDVSKRRSFLIAQDVQTVLPEAVDTVDPEALGLDYVAVIPLLVAALKESKQRIETLEAKVAALEAN